METLQTIISIMEPYLWMASIDLKDAYFHVPVAREYRRYLRFLIDGRCLQYTVTPFGLSPAPMLFTSILAVLIVWLRLRRVRLHAYLDDILIIGNSPRETLDALRLTIQVLTWAGFILNVKKSDLTPSQDLVFIGGRFVTPLGMVFLPEDRCAALIRVAHSFSWGALVQARLWLQLLGFMAAAISTVKFARLRMRPIQWYLKTHWKASKDSLDTPVMVRREVMTSLSWWTRSENLTQGMPFQWPPQEVTVTTDASMEGWGGHTTIQGRDLLFSGLWSPRERQAHINLLELRAIRLTLLQLTQSVKSKSVLLECDNTSAVCYVNKQGGTKSWSLCLEARLLYDWAIQHQVTLRAIHRPGVDNVLADYLSRSRPDPLEWSLSKRVCEDLFSQWGRPQIDLFASQQNHRLPLWYSRLPCPEALGSDAFTHSWTGLHVYAFPPTNLLLRTIIKFREDQVEEAILVAPNWPRKPWYELLLPMACEQPISLRQELGLLSQKLAKGTLFHPDLRTQNLAAWRLSGKRGKPQGFPRKLLPRL